LGGQNLVNLTSKNIKDIVFKNNCTCACIVVVIEIIIIIIIIIIIPVPTGCMEVNELNVFITPKTHRVIIALLRGLYDKFVDFAYSKNNR